MAVPTSGSAQDAQSRLDTILDTHPEFDAQHPQRDLTDKSSQQGKASTETVPPLSAQQDLISAKEKVEREELRKKHEKFLKSRAEEIRQQNLERSSAKTEAASGSPTAAASPSPDEKRTQLSADEIKRKAQEDWNKTPEGKKLRRLSESGPTVPQLSH
jgi:hypothetical protein